ncbi:hypothetical protein R3P38DRAFT_3015688 [Favolaschia claudopus]|uniref:Uncharacterized protein n=1 Tax=Favolaschia claudopus TaxID=2862362 RepID=A0AAW0AIK7_9AGAR
MGGGKEEGGACVEGEEGWVFLLCRFRDRNSRSGRRECIGKWDVRIDVRSQVDCFLGAEDAFAGDFCLGWGRGLLHWYYRLSHRRRDKLLLLLVQLPLGVSHPRRTRRHTPTVVRVAFAFTDSLVFAFAFGITRDGNDDRDRRVFGIGWGDAWRGTWRGDEGGVELALECAGARAAFLLLSRPCERWVGGVGCKVAVAVSIPLAFAEFSFAEVVSFAVSISVTVPIPMISRLPQRAHGCIHRRRL